jgi:hypothetical protein
MKKSLISLILLTTSVSYSEYEANDVIKSIHCSAKDVRATDDIYLLADLEIHGERTSPNEPLLLNYREDALIEVGAAMGDPGIPKLYEYEKATCHTRYYKTNSSSNLSGAHYKLTCSNNKGEYVYLDLSVKPIAGTQNYQASTYYPAYALTCAYEVF